MPDLAWLTANPIAHRGLHDSMAGIVENSAGAALAAVVAGYAIECDVQMSRDGEAMVFHDETLNRLTGASGRIDGRTASELLSIHLEESRDTILPLRAFLDLVGARVPVVVEIKSAFDGDMRLAERAAHTAVAYDGPVALKSFDPQVMTHLRFQRAALGIEKVPLGMVAEARYDHDEWRVLTADQRRLLGEFLHWENTRPDFLSYCIGDLPNAVPYLLRNALGIPVMTWTVRTPEQRDHAKLWADQIVFEGWRP